MSTNVQTTQTLLASQANAKLTKTIEDLRKVIDGLAGGATAQNELIEQIAQKETELNSLENQYKEESRRRQVEFDLDLKANELAKVTEVLAKQGRVSIPVAELQKLQDDYTKLSNNFKSELEAQVATVKQQVEASKAAALKQKDLELAAASAAEKAQISSLNDKVALLAKQVEDYKAQITSDREARVQEAQARGVAMVNVTSGK